MKTHERRRTGIASNSPGLEVERGVRPPGCARGTFNDACVGIAQIASFANPNQKRFCVVFLIFESTLETHRHGLERHSIRHFRIVTLNTASGGVSITPIAIGHAPASIDFSR
jgi:hypothetical protein